MKKIDANAIITLERGFDFADNSAEQQRIIFKLMILIAWALSDRE